jgi:DNA-binding transcriptional LysR family regulator
MALRIPDIEHLRTLVLVARKGSITNAAEELLRSQSAISIQISKLEEYFGYQLLVRHARGVSLTSHGRLVVSYADRIFALIGEMNDQIGREVLPESLKIGLWPEYSFGKLSRLLREFREQRESTCLRVVVSRTRELDRLMTEGALDVALLAMEFTELEPIVTWSEPLYWVASSDFVVDTARPLPLVMVMDDADEQKLYDWDRRIISSLEEAGLEWRIAYGTETIAAKVAAIEAGLGIGNLTAQAHTPSMRILTELDNLPPPPMVKLGIVAKEGLVSRPLDALVRTLLSLTGNVAPER